MIMSPRVFKAPKCRLSPCQGMFSHVGVCLGNVRCVFAVLRHVFAVSLMQPWLSDPEDAPFLDPVLRKRAVKVKHVKRREKKSDKKVGSRWPAGSYWELLGEHLGGSGGHWELLVSLWGLLGGPEDY